MVFKKKATRRRRSSGGVVRRARSAIGGFGGGKLAPIIHGALGGLASQVAGRFLPGYGIPIGYGAVGWFTNNQTLLTLAGVQASALIPIGGLLGGTTNGGGGGAI